MTKYKNEHITDVNVDQLAQSIVASRLPMDTGNLVTNFSKEVKKVEKFIKKGEHGNLKDLMVYNLAKAPAGSGHDNFLKGILVSFNISYSGHWAMQMGRYHFFDYVSSQSKMHKIEDFVLNNPQDYSKDLVKATQKYVDGKIDIDTLMDFVPMSFRLTARLQTNYLQLKTIYAQRENHKSKEWIRFCKWIETLPMSSFITDGTTNKINLLAENKRLKEENGRLQDIINFYEGDLDGETVEELRDTIQSLEETLSDCDCENDY